MITWSAANNMSNSSWITTQATSTTNATRGSAALSVVSQTSRLNWDAFFWSTMHWLVFVVGTIGNLLVITELVWNRSRSQIVTQLFVVSLCLAGLALMFSSAWVQALVLLSTDFPFDRLSCKIQYFWQAESIYCHAWNLVTVAADRFLGINKPGKDSFVNAKWAIVIIVTIWVTSSGSNVPLAFWSDNFTNKGTGKVTCTVAGVDPTARAIQLTVTRFVFYFIPLAITWICYLGLVIRMKASFTKVTHVAPVGASSAPQPVVGSSAKNQSGASASRKVTLMCMAITVSFTLTSLPHQINLLLVANASPSMAAYANTLTVYFRVFTMLNVCMNPFIYGFMWKPFRTALFKMVREVTHCCRRQDTKKVQTTATSMATTPVGRARHDRQRNKSMATVA